jgi:cell division protein ZapA
MAMVALQVGGRRYELLCRDGEEAHIERLAAQVDERMGSAGRALGSTNEARQLLMAALTLADDLLESRAAPPPPAPAPAVADDADPTEGLAEALDQLAARVEKLAETLEEERVRS